MVQGMADAVRGDLFIPAGAIRDLSVAVLDHGDRVLHHGERHHLDRSRQCGPPRQRRRKTRGKKSSWK